MNPSEYDLDELKGVATGGETGFTFGDNGRNGGSSAAAALSESQHRELLLLESMSSGDLEKPYLERLPESYAAELALFEWLEFLLANAGFRGALDALRYYRSIEWITAGVEETLGEYLRSFEAPAREDPPGLDRSDHVLSLVYVARLAAIHDPEAER